MNRIKVGDVIRINAQTADETSRNHHGKKPIKFRVLGVYEHHVLVQNTQNGIKESFTWWDLWKNAVIGEK